MGGKQSLASLLESGQSGEPSLELPEKGTELLRDAADGCPNGPFQLLEDRSPDDCRPPPRRFQSATHAIGFMLLAQVFSSFMSLSIRLLENSSSQLHALQILFARMSVTTLTITAYLWKQNKKDSILGKRENRGLLFVRALGGFLGVFGLYYSLRFINLSEATVVTFLMPLVASFGGYLLLRSPFSWHEIVLSIMSLVGVLFVAGPDTLFPVGQHSAVGYSSSRLWALGVGFLGVCGSAAAFLSIQAIGKSESPLTVVNYFAALCCLLSIILLAALPGLGFTSPESAKEWVLLVCSGVSGFLMQLLITLSLQAEKSSAAVNMVYTQIVFALALDAIVFQTLPKTTSLAGCVLICGSAIFLAWRKTRQSKNGSTTE